MPLSMHDAVTAMVRSLKNMDTILDKATAHAEGKKVDPTVLAQSRLALDMHPLARQIQIATDGAKGGAARLAEVEVPSFPDTETTIPELKARLAKTVAFLESIPAEKFAGAEDRTVTLKLGEREMTFPAVFFLFSFVLPNVYFHLTTAYAILRHNGVEIGKMDYLGGV
jgi:hypothetical protein